MVDSLSESIHGMLCPRHIEWLNVRIFWLYSTLRQASAPLIDTIHEHLEVCTRFCQQNHQIWWLFGAPNPTSPFKVSVADPQIVVTPHQASGPLRTVRIKNRPTSQLIHWLKGVAGTRIVLSMILITNTFQTTSRDQRVSWSKIVIFIQKPKMIFWILVLAK